MTLILIRNTAGEYSTETTTADPPHVIILVQLTPEESPDPDALIDAINTALAGEWYEITVPQRHIRTHPNVNARMVANLHNGDMVQINRKNGEWGQVNQLQRKGQAITPIYRHMWIYLTSLTRITKKQV